MDEWVGEVAQGMGFHHSWLQGEGVIPGWVDVGCVNCLDLFQHSPICSAVILSLLQFTMHVNI
jgi:hypothetical protein